MGMKKRIALVLVGLAVITVTVAAYYRANYASGGPQLVTAAVSRGNVIETVQATGTLEAVTTVQVGTQVSGTIKELHADFNSEVKKGQVIAELDPSSYEAKQAQASANVVSAKANAEKSRAAIADAKQKYERAQQLSVEGLIPATDLE